jgi:hypothetical protein
MWPLGPSAPSRLLEPGGDEDATPDVSARSTELNLMVGFHPQKPSRMQAWITASEWCEQPQPSVVDNIIATAGVGMGDGSEIRASSPLSQSSVQCVLDQNNLGSVVLRGALGFIDAVLGTSLRQRLTRTPAATSATADGTPVTSASDSASSGGGESRSSSSSSSSSSFGALCGSDTCPVDSSVRGYVSTLRDSVYTLAPAGKNPEQYRVYEAIMAGSIPIVETPAFFADAAALAPDVRNDPIVGDEATVASAGVSRTAGVAAAVRGAGRAALPVAASVDVDYASYAHTIPLQPSYGGIWRCRDRSIHAFLLATDAPVLYVHDWRRDLPPLLAAERSTHARRARQKRLRSWWLHAKEYWRQHLLIHLRRAATRPIDEHPWLSPSLTQGVGKPEEAN